MSDSVEPWTRGIRVYPEDGGTPTIYEFTDQKEKV